VIWVFIAYQPKGARALGYRWASAAVLVTTAVARRLIVRDAGIEAGEWLWRGSG
jgi:hypothetical protein